MEEPKALAALLAAASINASPAIPDQWSSYLLKARMPKTTAKTTADPTSSKSISDAIRRSRRMSRRSPRKY